MCLMKTGTRYMSVTGTPVSTPDLPVIPNEFALEFEVLDSKAGRSVVAKALNHGNSRLPFKDVREAAFSAGWVTRPRYFQGLVFSDSPIDGTERYLLYHINGNAPSQALFTVPDRNVPNGAASWHVFPLSLGTPEEGSAADFVTRFSDGQGFLMKSCDGSVMFAIFHEATDETPALWHVYGGGGSVYLHFLEEAKKEAKLHGLLLYEA